MAIDIQKYRQLLAEGRETQRFKVKYSEEDMITLLLESFKFEVELRRKIFSESDFVMSYISKAAKWLSGDHKFGLLLYGTIGSGKTTLMNSILNCLSIIHPEIHKTRLTALEITNIAKSDELNFKAIKKTNFLFIDDIGLEPQFVKVFGNEISPLTELLYYRYDNQLMTVITTNLLDEKIKPTYGERIEDRFAEMFDKIYFDLESFRKEKTN